MTQNIIYYHHNSLQTVIMSHVCVGSHSYNSRTMHMYIIMASDEQIVIFTIDY